jgi:hypothetical protein
MALHAEALIAQAITILDTIDGDADLEDGGKEPSLASRGGKPDHVACRCRQ